MSGCAMASDCCDACRQDFYHLIDCLIKDIQHLESKAVFLRYSLSKLLPEHEGEMLRCEIFSDLSGGYYDQAAYQQYIKRYCDGRDPMDGAKHCGLLTEISRGKEIVGF